MTYLDPVYDSFEISAVGDLSGTRPAGIPEWSVVIGAQYEAEVGNGTLTPRVSFLWQDETQMIEGLPGFLSRGTEAARAAAAPFTREVEDLSASLSYDLDNGLGFMIWGRNLLDHREHRRDLRHAGAAVRHLGLPERSADLRRYGALQVLSGLWWFCDLGMPTGSRAPDYWGAHAVFAACCRPVSRLGFSRRGADWRRPGLPATSQRGPGAASIFFSFFPPRFWSDRSSRVSLFKRDVFTIRIRAAGCSS